MPRFSRSSIATRVALLSGAITATAILCSAMFSLPVDGVHQHGLLVTDHYELAGRRLRKLHLAQAAKNLMKGSWLSPIKGPDPLQERRSIADGFCCTML